MIVPCLLRPAMLCAICVLAPAHAEDVPARLDWSQRVDLASPASGIVEAVLVQPGQTVRSGEVLARLDGRTHEAQIMEAKADTERLTQEEADARRELERAKELYARGVNSTTELDIAKLRHARASALLAATQARVERARRQLDETQVRAPFDAIVLRRQAEPGMATSQCQPTPLLGVARADELVARATLNLRQARGLSLGSVLEIAAGGRVHTGRLRALATDVAGVYVAEIALARAAELLPGQTVSLRLPD